MSYPNHFICLVEEIHGTSFSKSATSAGFVLCDWKRPRFVSWRQALEFPKSGQKWPLDNPSFGGLGEHEACSLSSSS